MEARLDLCRGLVHAHARDAYQVAAEEGNTRLHHPLDCEMRTHDVGGRILPCHVHVPAPCRETDESAAKAHRACCSYARWKRDSRVYRVVHARGRVPSPIPTALSPYHVHVPSPDPYPVADTHPDPYTPPSSIPSAHDPSHERGFCPPVESDAAVGAGASVHPSATSAYGPTVAVVAGAHACCHTPHTDLQAGDNLHGNARRVWADPGPGPLARARPGEGYGEVVGQRRVVSFLGTRCRWCCHDKVGTGIGVVVLVPQAQAAGDLLGPRQAVVVELVAIEIEMPNVTWSVSASAESRGASTG